MSFAAWADITSPAFPKSGVVSTDVDSFYDPSIDYSVFTGRVSDKDDTGRLLKIHVENNNSKLLRTGDEVKFHVNLHEKEGMCTGFVRAVEDFYFTIFVSRIKECWVENEYFPRGVQLTFYSTVMVKRVVEGSEYRKILLKQREDFLNQLNDINHFLWSFDEQKATTAAEYEKRVEDAKLSKLRALDGLLVKQKEFMDLQKDLIKKLDEVDQNIAHFRVERQEMFTDRWYLDHDAGVPVSVRPQLVKPPYKGKRWQDRDFY